MAHLRSYKTGAGEKRWAVVWQDNSGRRHWKTIPGPKRNAERYRADVEARLALGPLYEAAPERLGAFLQAWLERYEQRARFSTVARREQALKALGLLDSDIYLQHLSVAEIEDAVAAL